MSIETSLSIISISILVLTSLVLMFVFILLFVLLKVLPLISNSRKALNNLKASTIYIRKEVSYITKTIHEITTSSKKRFNSFDEAVSRINSSTHKLSSLLNGIIVSLEYFFKGKKNN